MAIFTPTPTPYNVKDPNNNPYVPVGQVGLPISKNAIPVSTPITGGTGWAGNTYGYNTTSYVVPTSQYNSVITNKPNPTPVPTPPAQDQGFINVGTISGNQRWNGVQWEPLGGTNGANDETAKLMAEIENSVNEGYGLLDQQEKTLNEQYPTDEANLVNKVKLQQDKATSEGDVLTADTTTAQDKQFNIIQNALEGAIRAYNALNQQRMARYGLGSSTGGAVGELAAQEFYRQQGGMNQEKVNVGTEFAKEFNKIKLFTKGKIDELEQYKNEAVQALKKDLADRLNTIATARVQVGQNKAAMRLSAIQDTIASAREIANQATTFRQTLAANALNNMQQVSGKVFTPAEIKAIMNDYGVSGFGTIGSNTQTTVNPNYYGKQQKYDEFGNLVDYTA